MKDPAVLIYFDKWISSTNGMRADFRAWYFDLIVHQYDKGHVPTDIDEMAGICRVRPSEYESFKQMVDQVVKHKFDLVDGFYKNSVIGEVISKRQEFKDKREKSGNIGVVVKMAKALKIYSDEVIESLKLHLYTLPVEDIIKLKDNQVLEQMLKLYINEDVDVDINKVNTLNEVLNKDLKISKNKKFYNSALNSELWIETVCMQQKCKKEYVISKLADFTLLIDAQTDYKLNDTDFRKHFVSWLNKNPSVKKNDNERPMVY